MTNLPFEGVSIGNCGKCGEYREIDLYGVCRECHEGCKDMSHDHRITERGAWCATCEKTVGWHVGRVLIILSVVGLIIFIAVKSFEAFKNHQKQIATARLNGK